MRALLVVALAAVGAGTACRPRPADSAPSPTTHEVLRVSVAPAVHLEVLAWRGTGPVLVFLTGFGNSAHVFDDFAPRFTDAYDVYAITRRGFGGSSRPESGYDLETRAQDIVRVLDSIGVRRAILAGHSLAADEMSRIAVAFPERVSALVFLDAYDYGPEFRKMGDESPNVPPGFPAMTAADSASIESFMTYRERVFGTAYPMDEVRTHTRFGPDGRFQGFVDRSIRQVQQGVGISRGEYARFTAPALAIYADVPSVTHQFPEYATYDDSARAKADSAFRLFDGWRRGVIARFRAEVPRGTVVEMPDAAHYLFLSHPDEVERLMRDFLSREVGPRSQ